MTCVVNSELSPQLELVEADLARTLSMSNVDDMNASRELHPLHPDKSPFHASTTGSLHDPELTADDSNTDNDEHAADVPDSLLWNGDEPRSKWKSSIR